MKKTLLTLLLIPVIGNAQTDKVAHFGVGFTASAVTTSLCQRYNIKHPVIIGIGVGTLLGIGKEVYDAQTNKGVCDWKDAGATIFGSALGSITVRISIPLNYGK